MSQSQRVAIITGASRGLGLVVARILAEREWLLVIGGRDVEALNRAADSLRALGAKVVPVEGDVADRSTRARLITAARTLGGLDLLVNNASELGGIRPLASFDESEPSDQAGEPDAGLLRILRVNLMAPLALVRLALPLLVERRGLIVNISSDAAHGAYPGWGTYGASKAALELASRTLATELRDCNVSTIIVDPGDMRTRMHQEAFPGQDISDRPLPEVTTPFWAWLFDQQAAEVNGERFAAQGKDKRWLQPA